jgi:hypothetical protein
MELGNIVFGNSRGEYPVDRSLQERWCLWMERLGFTISGYHESYEGWAFENDTFRMQPYYWGDCDCEDDHLEECPAMQPNFLFKPTGFRLDWYKYPLRDSYSSELLTSELIDEMFAECERSMR